MTCICCGGVCEPKTLKMVSSEMLLVEIAERKRQAQKQRDEFLKTDWRSIAFLYISMAVLFVLILLDICATLFVFQVEPIISGVASLLCFALFILILFKEARICAQFKKAYPEEDKLLSGS